MKLTPKRSARARLLIVGDTAFGENYHAKIESRGKANVLQTRGYDSMFDGVSDLLAGADVVVANLETPLALPVTESEQPKKRYVHWSDPRRASAVLKRRGITAASLGNNHACDQGEAGMRSTLEALAAAGISAFGAGLHAGEAARPFTTQLFAGDCRVPVTFIGGKQRRKTESDPQPYAGPRYGVHPWRSVRDGVRLRALRAAEPGRLLVAYPHWGSNYRWSKPRQQRLAHALIDAGADLVLGHGSHMMGEIERHRGRWIVYSLGNFVFGAPGRYRKIDGAVPFSFAACLDAEGAAGGLALTLRLYPLFCDNRVTGYRTRPVTAEEMSQVRLSLEHRCPGVEPVLEHWTADADDVGPFLTTPLATMTDCVTTHVPTRIVHEPDARAVAVSASAPAQSSAR